MSERSKLLAVGGEWDEVEYSGERGFVGEIGSQTVLG